MIKDLKDLNDIKESGVYKFDTNAIKMIPMTPENMSMISISHDTTNKTYTVTVCGNGKIAEKTVSEKEFVSGGCGETIRELYREVMLTKDIDPESL